jgi:hypothetical protein
LVIANRLTEVRADRYHGVTTIWSLKQQAVVAECSGWIVWFDFNTGKAANLLEMGGVWKTLYDGLVRQVEDTERSRAAREVDKKKGAKL